MKLIKSVIFLIVAGLLIVSALFITQADNGSVQAAAPPEPSNHPTYSKGTIKSASEHDYPPFCTVSKDGKADGFSVELLRAALSAVGLKVEFKTGPWEQLKKELGEGTIQVLPLVGRTPEREAMYDFTFPYLSVHGAIFVRKGDARIKTIDDLADKTVVVMKGDNAEEFVRRKKISSHIIAVDTYTGAMKLLDAGAYDAVIAQRLMGIQLLRKMEVKTVVPLDFVIHDFRQDFCFAVRDGDKELLSLLNEGLSVVIANGTFNQLHEKWFGPLSDHPMSFKDGMKYFLIVLIPLAVFFVLLLIVLLRREVRKKTKSLLQKIEEHKLAMTMLQESEERYRILFSRASDGIFTLSANGKLIAVNESLARMHGYSLEEMQQMNLGDLDTPETAEMIPDRMRRLLAGETLTFEVQHYHKNGHVFPLEVSASPISIGGEFYIQCFHRDITERKLTEDALRESEARYIDLYDNAPDMYISVYARTGRILQCNQTLAAELGYTKAEIIGREITDLYNPDSVEDMKKALGVFVETGEIHDKELQVRRKDGTVIDISLNASAVRDEEGRILYSRSSWRNITDKKLLERQLLHAQKMETIGTLAGGVAHDFNNILTVIIGTVSILKRRFSKEDPLQLLFDHIDKAAESAAALTRNLLTFSRKQIIYLRRMEVSEMVRKQGNFLVRIIGEDIEFRTKLADEELFVMADFNQMEQVFMNLAGNARDAMPMGGAFTISTKSVIIDNEYIGSHGYGTPGEYALISISDAGAGMDEYTQGRIFEPFFTTKEIDKGTGLGLSVVYGIIKQHNGYINVRSGPGEGTTFNIYLPLVKNPAEDSAGEKRNESLPQVYATETVLVAEDSAALRNLIEFVLTEAGYKVVAAEDGEDALNKFTDNPGSIQLVLLDVVMPKKNGKEVYDAMKKIKTNIKVLFFSGYSEDIIHRRDIIKEGMEIISKPIKPDVLLQKIRKALDMV